MPRRLYKTKDCGRKQQTHDRDDDPFRMNSVLHSMTLLWFLHIGSKIRINVIRCTYLSYAFMWRKSINKSERHFGILIIHRVNKITVKDSEIIAQFIPSPPRYYRRKFCIVYSMLVKKNLIRLLWQYQKLFNSINVFYKSINVKFLSKRLHKIATCSSSYYL